ncbi:MULTISPECIES: AraC family transcriptional regulator [unclassified Rathayibacter]|uniref:AraC family transcriptional regulator n=1 Tax=unclassified Rathayibacter TaxID=2609250 RepID=UPI0010486444|nr:MULTISPECIES: AraC family transcriptional regulator [unclassified Rathayibacter]TCL82580.1 AraC-like DNA-binding protein [Rathayibacter sp. PhB192]TCM27919.1 AraC-like DNA-binding protein [Rathayibacter sp. PhB179]
MTAAPGSAAPGTARQHLAAAADLARRHLEHPERAAALDLRLHRVTAPTSLVYTRFPPTLSLVLSGRKRSIVGDSDEQWGAGRFLITPVDLPVIAAVVETGEQGDFVSANWHLDPVLVAEVAGLVAHRPAAAIPERIGTITPELADALHRLFRLLDVPEEIPVLGPAVSRELVLRLLQSDQAPRLLSASSAVRSAAVTRAVDAMTGALAHGWTLDALAAEASTSVPTLTRRFRELTGMSPLGYLRRLRLGEARRLLLVRGETAAGAAAAVGYASASHFGRDYRRAYETTPAADAALHPGRLVQVD